MPLFAAESSELLAPFLSGSANAVPMGSIMVAMGWFLRHLLIKVVPDFIASHLDAIKSMNSAHASTIARIEANGKEQTNAIVGCLKDITDQLRELSKRVDYLYVKHKDEGTP